MNADSTPLLKEREFLTAAGTETYLLFQQGFPLRDFCAFEIFNDNEALAELESKYLHPILTTAFEHGKGLLLDALLWRAHPDYIEALGYAPGDLKHINQRAVATTQRAVENWRLAAAPGAAEMPVLISADLGPRGDGYKLEDAAPTAEAARDYHRAQLEVLSDTDIDVVCALTMTNANEAIGIVEAARDLERPVIVSATVETDGCLPDGSALCDFIRRVDDATGARPIFYMINCAHPTHLESTLSAAKDAGEDWLHRLKGFRANCSKKSHEDLDNSTELDRGNPVELAGELGAMRKAFGFSVLGGCCGTDFEHIAAIAEATSVGCV